MTSKNFFKSLETYKTQFYRLLLKISDSQNKLLVQGGILEIYDEMTTHQHDHELELIREMIFYLQESICLNNNIYMEVREKIAGSEFYKFNIEEQCSEIISADEYLIAKELYKDPRNINDNLKINFKPFYKKFPGITDYKNIGSGVEYLNKYLSSQMFNNREKWQQILFDFLRLHSYDSKQLILNDRIENPQHLSENIDKALRFITGSIKKESYKIIRHKLSELGFEEGLGANGERISENLRLLNNLLESPDHISLQNFLSRIPMIFNIALVSTHGYFAQEGVLGLPDTGGQVVYILDQVKALEKSLTESLKLSGLDITPKIIILTRLIPNAGNTTCNQRLEKVYDTNNTWILRIPFRNHNPKVTDNWISRFEIYPYLEEYAEDAHKQLLAEFGRRPDLVIGNYTDGNIIATILARKFGVTQCNIAHALEKSKYLYSGLYWKELEEQYHFSLQYTADLIAMNSADFLITSTYQEIAGTDKSVGQYESYKSFTMPELFRVTSGINLFHPKFNVVSPGVNTKIFFPYTKNENRFIELKDKLEDILFNISDDPEIRGNLEDKNRIPLFSMARLDKIKNLTSLARWFGENKELQENCNLILVAGNLNPERSSDLEEKDQIVNMHNIMNEYQLDGKMRWIGKLFRKDETGEVYRIIADHKGIFIQPGLFEGFGLTVLEAMISGLPTFATKYGGPLEIIEDEISGYHIDPINQSEAVGKIINFVRKMKKDDKLWKKISKNGISRVNERYNWDLYSKRLISLSKIYGFWKYAIKLDVSELYAYLDVLFYLLYKPMSKKLLEKHNSI